MYINPGYVNFIQLVKENEGDENNEVVLKPGEFFTIAFKLQIGVVPAQYDISDLLTSFNLSTNLHSDHNGIRSQMLGSARSSNRFSTNIGAVSQERPYKTFWERMEKFI